MRPGNILLSVFRLYPRCFRKAFLTATLSSTNRKRSQPAVRTFWPLASVVTKSHSNVPMSPAATTFQIFEFAVGIAIEESLHTTTDVVLANIAFAKCVGSDRRMVDAVLGEEAGGQIGVLSTRLQILRPARASFLRTFIPHSSRGVCRRSID